MYQEQRLNKILELLAEKRQLSAKEMVDYFHVSKDTIRRDFAILSERKLVQRTHGGILPLENKQQILSFNDRSKKFTKEKRKIAQKAYELIEEEQLLYFDVSTIILQLAQLMNQKNTIYSHSLDNAIMLSGQKQIDFHLLGGKFYPKNRFYYSLNEAELLEHLQFDIAFFGAASLKNGQVSYEDAEDAYIKKLVMQHSQTKVLLAEQEKWQKNSNYILSDISSFDYWITDQKPTTEIKTLLPDTLKIIY